ncbi:hypothetical protein [Burkholderia pseudomallei]|uniref:hypothetical protein n=1 Tax=Burkholderia pseudomallei TaxID=28450 RepID=UPI000A1A0D4E|nr:hypothetical protein [Burkholderia pseudomallei]ARL04375.1 hypothetical protein BOC44_21670 [Burkholderia pseudomallei]
MENIEHKSTYGVVVTPDTLDEELKAQQALLGMVGAEHIVFLSVSPCDIQRRMDWPQVKAAFESCGADVSVESVAPGEVFRYADRMRILDQVGVR